MDDSISKRSILANCHALRAAFEAGTLGNMRMPEEAKPEFGSDEQERRFAYFTLPMCLNYQRNSYALWEAATKTYLDTTVSDVFSVEKSARMPSDDLRAKLLKYKVALQPQKHIDSWQRVSAAFFNHWGSIERFLRFCEHDFAKMKEVVQSRHKKEFPYLSGPKIFNYWCYILIEYCEIALSNRSFIEIAPDTHVLQASVKLGLLTPLEANRMSREQVSERWRTLLNDTTLSPIDMHSPLWFWSRNSFQYELAVPQV